MKMNVDICVIGAGSGGLSVAAVTSQLGLNTVLIERADMGGDCLNTGCVPSKALLAAGKRAQMHRKDDIKGIKPHEPEIDFSAVKDHVFDTIKTIEPHDSQERFESLGVHVIRETGKFISKNEVQAGDTIIKAKHFVVATGSRAFVPPIKGLDIEKTLTNENIFELREQPKHLLIVGGGPIGVEMAQAHKRLGCEVSIFDMGRVLPRDDQENAEIVRQTLKDEGIKFFENVAVNEVKHGTKNVTLKIEQDGKALDVKGSHLLIAAGRRANIEKLDLDKAGIKYGRRGITVNARLKTSNKRVWAIGDVAGGPQFTHIAGYHAGIIIRNICFKMPAKVDYTALPWVTYSDPELAQVGLTETDAREKYGDSIKTTSWHFGENDRALAERATKGQVRVIMDKKTRIIGASMVGKNAGELMGVWSLAIQKGLKLSDIAGMIAPYPTFGEINKRAAGDYYKSALFGDKTKFVVKLLQKLPF